MQSHFKVTMLPRGQQTLHRFLAPKAAPAATTTIALPTELAKEFAGVQAASAEQLEAAMHRSYEAALQRAWEIEEMGRIYDELMCEYSLIHSLEEQLLAEGQDPEEVRRQLYSS